MIPDPHPPLAFTLTGRVKPYTIRTRASLHASERSRDYYASQQNLAYQLREQMNGRPPLVGQVGFSVVFTRTKRLADLDNLIKAVSDAANGIAWADDRQVRCIEAHLQSGNEDVTTLKVWTL